MAPWTKLARDAGYVMLGLGVIRFQKAAVRRREIETEISGRLGPLREVLPRPVRDRLPKPPA